MANVRWNELRVGLQQLSSRMLKHRVSLAAGGLAFFTALAIAPAAIAFGTVAGLVLDPDRLRISLQELVARTPGLAPLSDVIDPIVGVVESASARGFSAVAVVGLVVAVVASSRVVVSIRQSLDEAFGIVFERSGLLQRLAATAVTFVAVVLAVVFMVLLAVLPKVLDAFDVRAGVASVAPVLGYLVVLVVAYSVIWALYRFGPHHRIAVPFLSLGVACAAAGVLAASVGVGVYVQFSSTVSATLTIFGAPLVVLLWLYFVALAVLTGAEITGLRREPQVTVQQQR
jgi:membrane protein